ncbi:MAG: AMP-binding protein, partial [Acidimicrobiia bacterium]|nr:AMP-binding protein [Acidimicrobiia bacterium]
SGDETYTYAETLDRVLRAAAGLRAAGVNEGDRVLVTARNTAEYLFIWLALMEVGAVQVAINPAGTSDEFEGFVRQVDPQYVVTDDVIAGLFAGDPDTRGPADLDPEDLAVMIPTSGTTGRSKLVMQTHLAYVMAGEGFPYWMQLTADDRLMTSLPLFHINAPAYTTLGSVAARASMVLLPGFSARSFIDDARRYGATEFNSIGAMLEILMRQPEGEDDADNPLRRCYTGPSPTKERQEEIERRFGIEVVCGYGLSESPYGLMWRHGTRPFGTLGSPRQHPTLGTVNEARLTSEGELELRNPVIMKGYYEMPDETAAVLVDGWLRTGDLVTENDDGTYTFVGRQKEVIRRRGENLSPAEVEAALERHPAVAEAAVVGVPSELSEEEVKAFVVATSGMELDVRELRDFAADQLTRFKVPRYFEVVDELPHTPTGRLAKHKLSRERTAEEVDVDGA